MSRIVKGSNKGEVISKFKIKKLIRAKLLDKKMSVSTDAVDYFYKIIHNFVNTIIDEAVKSNYSEIRPIDIRRGKNKLKYKLVIDVCNEIDWTYETISTMRNRLHRYMEQESEKNEPTEDS